MDTTIVSVRDLTKTFTIGETRIHALRGVSFDIDPGEFVALTGPSGSGKSTLLHVIGGLQQPTRGRVMLAGRDIARLSKDELAHVRNQDIGFIFQRFNLLPGVPALENVELPLLYADVGSARQRHIRAVAALETVGLGDRLHHTPGQLSGGQQQRVAIARALINHPSLLLADEPTGNLDSRSSVELMGIFEHLNLEQHMTIILVTHEHEIAEFATRVMMFRDGRIVGDHPVVHRRTVDAELQRLAPPLTTRAA